MEREKCKKEGDSGAIRLMMALARPNAVDESDRDSESRSCEDEKAAERRRVFKRDSLDFTNLTQELLLVSFIMFRPLFSRCLSGIK